MTAQRHISYFQPPAIDPALSAAATGPRGVGQGDYLKNGPPC
jgi:hypothetical protein